MVFEFYMHYENEGSGFVLPRFFFQYADLIGETNDNENFNLSLENVNENKVYDRGKKF